MVIVMVYGMVCYNISLNVGGLQNFVFFLETLKELPIMGTIAFLIEFYVIGKLSRKLAFRLVNPKTDKPIFLVLAISSIIVCFMCPIMSLVETSLLGQRSISTLFAR